MLNVYTEWCSVVSTVCHRLYPDKHQSSVPNCTAHNPPSPVHHPWPSRTTICDFYRLNKFATSYITLHGTDCYMKCISSSGVAYQKKIIIHLRENILNKQYVSWDLKHSLFLDFFSITYRKRFAYKIYVLGVPCGKCIFYNFADRTKFVILFHLQRLGAEHYSFSFFKLLKNKIYKIILIFLFANGTFLYNICFLFCCFYFKQMENGKPKTVAV